MSVSLVILQIFMMKLNETQLFFKACQFLKATNIYFWNKICICLCYCLLSSIKSVSYIQVSWRVTDRILCQVKGKKNQDKTRHEQYDKVTNKQLLKIDIYNPKEFCYFSSSFGANSLYLFLKTEA